VKPVRIFGYEPALWIGVLASSLSLGTAVGVPGLSQYQVAAVVAGVNTVAAAAMAWQVRPVAPAVFTNVVGALAALGLAYGFSVPSEAVGAVNFVVLNVLALLTRGQVSPTGATEAVAPSAPEPVVAAGVDQRSGQRSPRSL
jgi:hypothetical protein